MMKYEVIRAEEEWQRAGAYSVRIQGMNPPARCNKEKLENKDVPVEGAIEDISRASESFTWISRE